MGMDEVIRASSSLALIEDARSYLDGHGCLLRRSSGTWNMMKTKTSEMVEAYNVTLIQTKPLRRWHTLLSTGCLLETIDYFLGLNPGYVSKLFTIYKDYSAVGKEMPYSYGQRIFGLPHRDINQWEMCVEKLRYNPTTRHAWITLHRPLDRTRSFIPCTTQLGFQINSAGKLDMFTYMRSQDILRGLPIDLFAWTIFHEQMALEVGLPMGTYRHNIANMHYYKKDFKKLDAINNAVMSSLEREAPLLTLKEKARIITYWDMMDKKGLGNAKLTEKAINNFLVSKSTGVYWLEYTDLILFG